MKTKYDNLEWSAGWRHTSGGGFFVSVVRGRLPGESEPVEVLDIGFGKVGPLNWASKTREQAEEMAQFIADRLNAGRK